MTETESQTPGSDALASLVGLLRDRLSVTLAQVVRADVSISAERVEEAIGSLAGVDVDLADSIALQRAIILLRRSQGSGI